MSAPVDRIASGGADASSAPPLVIANVSRRRFLQGVSALGGLVLAVGLPSAVRAADAKKYGADGMPNGWVDNPLAFVSIAEDGTVTIVCHRSEMGQGVRTGMPMIVADELEADWKRVRVAQAPGDEKKFGNQDTDGSRSTRHFFDPMRRCGAAARTMLEAAAAEGWKVPVTEVEARNHEVVHRASGRRAGYGSLAKAAASQPVPARESLRLKDPSKFRYIGKGQLKLVDGLDIATGKAQYGIDTRLDGMLYAVVARPPVYGGKVVSFDPAEALKVSGVERVVQIETSPPPAHFNPVGGVAVLARNTWAAMQGRRALKIAWEDGPNASYDSTAFKATLEDAAHKPGKVVRNDGDFDAAAGRAARRVEAEYYVPHLAHATMEPPAATARITGGKCEVWGCFQSPQATRDMVAKRLGMSSALQGGGRQAGQGHLDPRRRPAQFLLPHGLGRAPRGRRRRAGQAGRVAAPQRSADHHLHVQRGGEERGALRARHGRHQRPLRHPQRAHREPRGHRAHADRLVPIGLEHSSRVRRPVVRG
jgi:isoquinoline 1-oxidoreductase beta subunit